MAAVDDWVSPPARPSLGEGEVSVWRLASGDPRPLEAALARHLAVEPGSLTLERTRLGKPTLVGSPFQASLSHSGDATLVAVAEGRDVGVDVERLRPGAERWALVNHVLTDGERRSLEGVPPDRGADAFLAMWTRKEALLKAAGLGLGVDPSFVELEGDSVVALPPELGSARDWTLADVPLPGYVAALAVRGELSTLHLYDARRTQRDRPIRPDRVDGTPESRRLR